MTEPLVSIIIPTYNGERFVAQAIESGLNQTYQRREVIVVDDGSSDGTLDVVRSFGTSVRWFAGENRGVAAARNTGAREAQGELLQFLDQDDVLYPEKLQRQVPLAIEHRPGVVICDADIIELETGKCRGRWGVGAECTIDSVVHALKRVAQTSGPLHWKETFHSVEGFREDTPPCDDRDIMLRLACAGVTFEHLPEVLYVWHCTLGSQSKRDPGAALRMDFRIGRDAYAQLADAGGLNEQRCAAFACYFFGIGRRAVRVGEAELANEGFQEAHRIHPAGGYWNVYSPGTRLVARMLGPQRTERLVVWKRRMFRQELMR